MIDFRQNLENEMKKEEEIMNRISIIKNIKTEKVQLNYRLRRDYNNGESIEISQGSSNISKDNIPLISDGFSKCQAVVIKNNATGKIGVLHIEPDGNFTNAHVKTLSEIDGHFTYMDQKEFSDDIDAFILYRDDRTPTLLYEYLNRRKYNINIIPVTPGQDNRRGVIYDPRTNDIIVHTREEENDKLTYYKGFENHSQDKITKETKKEIHDRIANN